MQKNEDCNKKAGHKVKNMTGELKKVRERERASESAPQHHTEFSYPPAEQLPQSIHVCPRLSEKQIWVILPFKNACVPVLFIFMLHANSKHRHERDYLLVWMKSIVQPKTEPPANDLVYYRSNEPTSTTWEGTWSDNTWERKITNETPLIFCRKAMRLRAIVKSLQLIPQSHSLGEIKKISVENEASVDSTEL